MKGGQRLNDPVTIDLGQFDSSFANLAVSRDLSDLCSICAEDPDQEIHSDRGYLVDPGMQCLICGAWLGSTPTFGY
jgi:hypothetical protein